MATKTPALARRLEELPAVLPDLVNARALLFVGSGFSRALTHAPTWDQLLQKLWSDIGEKPGVWESVLANDPYGQMDVLDTLYLREWLHRHGGSHPPPTPDHPLKVAICNFFHRNKFETEEWNLWERLTRLGFSNWVTTNWDTLIEDNFQLQGHHPMVVRRGALHEDIARANLEGVEAATADRPFVLKFHGCLSAPHDMVVTRRDLDEFLQRDLYLKSLMVKNLMERTVLYVGYSLRDDNILRVIADVNAEARRISKDGTLAARQVLFVRSDPGTSDRKRELDELGVHVIEYTGLDELVIAIEHLQRKRPAVVAADRLVLELLRSQRQRSVAVAQLGRFGLTAMLSTDLGAFFGVSRGITAVPDWFRREALPKQRFTVHQWSAAFCNLLNARRTPGGVSRYVLQPRGPAFQDFDARVERLLVGIALHVAKRHQKRFAADWPPLASIVNALLEHEQATDQDASRIIVGIALFAPSYEDGRFVHRLEDALETVARSSSLAEVEGVYDVYLRRDAFDLLVSGLRARTPSRPFGFIAPLGRILRRVRTDDPRLVRRLFNVAKRAVSTIGLDECRYFFHSRDEAIEMGLDEPFAKWIYSDA